MKKRVVIYARVSTTAQETENQILQLRVYSESQQWTIVDVITDWMTGSKGIADRKGLEKVFNMAHRKQFDVLLIWSLDRLSREGSRKTVEYLGRLESCGIDWHSFTEPYLSSMGVFSDAVISILATLARQEKIRIGERTRSGLERVRRQGIRLGRPPTPETTVAEMVQLRKEGKSLSEIGVQFNVTAARVCQIVKSAERKGDTQCPKPTSM